MLKSLFAFIVASTFMVPLAEARRDQRREVRQQGRIAEGVKSGELTRPEARRLRHGQHRVDVAQRKAKADGEVTAEEQAKLEKMQDVQSKRIYRQKHDDQQRAGNQDPAAPSTSGQ